MFTNEVGMYLKKIGNRLERGKNRRLKDMGLTGTQMEVLEYLHCREEKECGLCSVAAYFDVKHTSVLHVVKLLEKKGLIVREERQEGKRCRRMLLTAEGEALMAKVTLDKSRLDRILLKGMTGEEIQILQRLLQRAYENLKEEERTEAEGLFQ